MSVTATLKLVLRDLPETRESGGMVYMALTNEPKGLPKNITLDSGPLYLTSPVKQWRAACTKAEQIRSSGAFSIELAGPFFFLIILRNVCTIRHRIKGAEYGPI